MIIFLSAFALYFLTSHFASPAPSDNYVVLANAWLHGHVWIGYSEPPNIDCVMYVGRCYVIEGPLPAVLMLPAVAIYGLDANQSHVCVVAAAITVAAFDLLLLRMNIDAGLRPWLVILLAVGTVFWWCASNPNVWMFAHVVTVMFLVLALVEWYGKRRYWLVGLFFACAALSRFAVILAVYPFLYWTITDSSSRFRNVGSFLAGFLPLMVLQSLYDYARWHTPLDIGYTLFYHKDPAGSPIGSPFILAHLPFNLYSYFFLGPQFSSAPPWINPTYLGVALTLTSPALALALAAPKSKETFVMWSGAILCAIPGLLYYVNGYSQFGMRHTLDFTPFLLCLAARGITRCPYGLSFGLIAYSVLANAYGVWYYGWRA